MLPHLEYGMTTTEAPAFKVSVEKPAAWARRLTITVPAERIEREKKEAVQRLSRRANLPGFRKGKVPAGVMQKRFGPAIEQEAIEKVIGDAYRQAIESEGLQPITQGSIDNIDYQPGTDLTFHVELEIRPEIELNRLGGFTVLREQPSITDQQVDEVLQRLREENATWRSKESEVPLAGDMATVEITPLDDATSAEPSKPRRYQIVIGEGQAVPAVEDAIRTLRGGEEADFDVALPENPEDPSSPARAHRMHIRMVEVQTPEYATLDDEFAKGLGDFEDLAALRSRVREDLQKESEREAERGVRMQLVEQLVQANQFEVPSSMVQKYLERLMPTREGADEEQMNAARHQMWPAAEQALKRSLVLERVAELEALNPTPAELEARVDELAERMGRPRAEVLTQLRKSGRLDELEHEMMEEKVFQYLKSLSDIQ
jgi:trigger factor